MILTVCGNRVGLAGGVSGLFTKAKSSLQGGWLADKHCDWQKISKDETETADREFNSLSREG